ncbi:AAA family ATPase [Treponema sp. TIM-1]|uniref:AAA family ATPase n=1 Tax=Treponema sp. TIM-1 TaxID=2898417 RepID=UPI00398105FA
MKYYLDNFRGFQDTCVDLRDVNFLVGENSSGKTSLINALTIMSYYRFWTEAVITDEIEFKSFSDLHSVNATRDYFTLGSINNDKTIHVYSFTNDDGLANGFREIIYTGDHELCIMARKPKKILAYFDTSFIVKMNDKSLSELLDYADSIDKKNEWNVDGLYYGSDVLVPFYEIRTVLRSKKEGSFPVDFFTKAGMDTFSIESSTFLAPIRAKPQAIYSGGKKSFSAEGNHIPFTIKELLSDKEFYPVHIKEMLNDYGKESGLFDSLDVKRFGDNKTDPFELLIKKDKSNYKISLVGYGVSQILPIIMEMLQLKSGLFSIQQPEVHLHPKAQSAFGGFLYKAARREAETFFVVETHSDYIIDRFRYQMKESENKVPAQVLFFKNDGAHNIITPIEIKNDGKYDTESEAFEDFRSFFIDESFRVMEI